MDYAHSTTIATDYDEYFAFNRLFEFDEQLVLDALRANDSRGLIADFGCGTGRALTRLCSAGFRGLAIDLSAHMLAIVQEKADVDQLPIECVQANLVDLSCFADNCVDHGVCLFSTLGMIRGAEFRALALEHFRRMIKPGGQFVIHVHNFWYNLYDPGGPWWVLRSVWRDWCDAGFERGDKFFPYRGLPNMFLHVFTKAELLGALRLAGFHVEQCVSLDPRRHRALKTPWLFGRLRANGWIVVCKASE